MSETKLEPQYNGDTLTGHLRNALQVLSIVKSRPCANPGMEHRATLAAYAELYAIEKRINNALVMIEGTIKVKAMLDTIGAEDDRNRSIAVVTVGAPGWRENQTCPEGWSVELRERGDEKGRRFELKEGTAHRGMFRYMEDAISEARKLVDSSCIGADDDRNRSL